MMRRSIGTILLAMAVVACGDTAPEDAEAFIVTDSAGVTLIHNNVSSAVTLHADEEWRIGSVDGPPETLFHLIRRVATSPNGDIHVALLGANQIRVFHADGSFSHAIGRMGQGPGEFAGLSTFYLLGDTIVALDVSNARMTIFAGDGDFIGSVPIPRFGGGLATPMAPFRDGWWVILRPDPWEWPEHGRMNEARRTAVAVDGARNIAVAFDRVELASDSAGWSMELSDGRSFGMTMGTALTSQRPLWEPRTPVVVDDEGRLHVAARDETTWASST